MHGPTLTQGSSHLHDLWMAFRETRARDIDVGIRSHDSRVLAPMNTVVWSAVLWAQAASLSVDGEASRAWVTVDPADTVLSGLSHRHVVVADRLEGNVRFDEDAGTCSVQVQTSVTDLRVDPTEKRKELGFEKKLSDADRKSVRKNMLAQGQLWAQRFPRIRFSADSCEWLGEGRVFVKGRLKIRGVSTRLYLPVRLEPVEEGIRVRTEFIKRHEDFGFEPYKAALGALKNGEVLSFEVDIRLRTRAAGPDGP